MKKIIGVYLILILLTCVFCNTVNAATSDIFSVTDASGSKGEDVTVYIKLDKEIEFASADLVLEYDTSKLEFVKYVELDLLKDSAMSLANNNSNTGKIAIGYVSNPTSATQTKDPSQMLSVTFKIKDDSTDKIPLNLKCTTLKKDSGESIQASDAQSQISIVKKSNGSESEAPTSTVDKTPAEKTNQENGNTSQVKDNTSPEKNKPTEIIITEEKDTTKATSILPKTGIKTIIPITLVFLVIISIYFYKKYINLDF